MRSTQQLRSHLQLLCARQSGRALEQVAPGFDRATILSCCALAGTVPGRMALQAAAPVLEATACEFHGSAQRQLTQLRQLAALTGFIGLGSAG